MSTLFVTGDTAPALTGTLSGADGPASLVGATVELHIQLPDKTTILTRTPTITDAAAGKWSYTWEPGELVEGTWLLEAQVTYGSGAVQTFPTNGYANFAVRAQMA